MMMAYDSNLWSLKRAFIRERDFWSKDAHIHGRPSFVKFEVTLSQEYERNAVLYS